MDDLNAVRERFKADRFATQALGAEIEDIGDGYARCSFTVGGVHENARGAVMGGALFTLADFTFAVAANQDGRTVVSLTNQITFLSPAKGRRITAEARCVKQGRTACYYQVSVFDELGTKIAEVTVNGFVVGR